MNKLTILLLSLFSSFAWAQSSAVIFQDTTTFFPNQEILNNDDIEWGYLMVPEDWDAPNARKIKLAVAKLNSKSKEADPDQVVMIDGGPGAGSIEGIWWWINHPLREKNNIILVDARGTGFSQPRLCPDLGNEFLKILAKNQSPNEDVEDKVRAKGAF